MLVTGASGGVGGTALAILADRGYEVWAATGKPDEADRLRTMGAAGILTRDEVTGEGKPLESERWAGAVDAVGAATLPYVLRTLRIGGAVASSGQCRRRQRSRRRSSRSSCAASRCSGWIRSTCRSAGGASCGTAWRPTSGRATSARHCTEVTLDTLDEALDGIVAGAARGRWIVRSAARRGSRQSSSPRSCAQRAFERAPDVLGRIGRERRRRDGIVERELARVDPAGQLGERENSDAACASAKPGPPWSPWPGTTTPGASSATRKAVSGQSSG